MKLTSILLSMLLLGLTVHAFAQDGNDQNQGGGITVSGDPTQVQVGHDQATTTGGQLVIPDDQQQGPPPAQATQSVRDDAAHQRLDGHDGEIGKLNGDVAGLKADFEAYKAASRNERLAAYMGDNVRLASAQTRKSTARAKLRRKGVSEKTFSEPALFKALEAALKSGKLDGLLKSRLNTWMADEGTTLGRMFAATQKIANLEITLYGDKDNPTDDMAYRLENLEKWAATGQTQPFDPSKNYAAVDSGQTPDPAAPAAGTTPSAPAEKGAVTVPPKGTEPANPPVDQPKDPAEKGKEEAKPSSSLLEKAKTPEGLGTMGLLTLALGCLALPGVRRRITNAR